MAWVGGCRNYKDIEEALTAHPEIEQAEVTSVVRVDRGMDLTIQIAGLAGTAEVSEVIEL